MTSPTTDDTEIVVRRSPGRPRDEGLDQHIIEVTLALIDAEEEVTVSRIVSRGGVSRAALYRRWPSLTTLIAAALDFGRRVPPEIPPGVNLREAVLAAMFGNAASANAAEYSEARFRQRIRLVMADRELQKTYWTSHVARRRVPLETAFRDRMKQGTLRPDLNVEACFDAIAGAAYYQLVVRGDQHDDPKTHARMHAAFDIVWRGMLAGAASSVR